MKLRLGALTFTLKNSYLRGDTYYFQRPIPRDLQRHYGKKTVKINLKTSNVGQAAHMIDALNKRYEEEWRMLRAAPESSLKATRKHAEAFLASWGIVPSAERDETTEMAVQLFHDHLEKKRTAHADGDEQVYREASGAEYLTAVESTAAQMVAGTLEDSLSDALELYISHHKKRDDEKFTGFSRAAFKTLTDVIGDKPIAKTAREDARKYVDHQLSKGLKTGTVRRRISTISAVFASYIREKELMRTNPFSGEPAQVTAISAMSDWRSLGASSVASSGAAGRYVMRPDGETGGQPDGGVEGVIKGSLWWAEDGRDQPARWAWKRDGWGFKKQVRSVAR
ncbi:hypothetical protein NUV25_33340 [Burkholderia pseudomultivorans]|uniref:DUF6538 domain-containing protein n=1 Tax=Burkholderia pseudomultivorans TaxID=1207504 RepID=UPI00287483C6|nr:DUF6538 domain-containing protein [Burkholderia pseudomultivorans]MDS0862595.1 hypothetical protein [Burkholderia pseudomultivorans]